MSPKKRIEVEPEEPEAEGWESLAKEEAGGSLKASPELEEALREAAAAVEEASVGTPAGDQAQVEPAEGELKEAQDRLLRLQADFENFRRRALRERNEAQQYGHQNLVKDLLSTVDNLDRAIDHARRSGGGDLENLLQGVELVQRELLVALAKNGVTPIEAIGQPFDPALHEAMAQAPDATVTPNTVVEELQKGYKLRDRLLRPSRVIVARAAEEGDAPRDEEGEAKPGQGEATD
jgi:molecular chaperone GrpE